MSEPMAKVCTLGLWHLGCVTSVCMAEAGYEVAGYDPQEAVVDDLNRGRPPIFEPGLADLLRKNLDAGRLRFTASLPEAARGAKYVWLTYDTAVDDEDEADLSLLRTTVARLGPALQDGATVLVSSQVPVGSCREFAQTLRGAEQGLSVGVAYVPENLRLGQAIECFLRPEKIVIGADDAATLAAAEALFAPWSAPFLHMDLATAEMSKHAVNAFLATCISFANELAGVCDAVGADAVAVANVLASDARIGGRLPLRPGLGFAGGTLARDLKALTAVAGRDGVRLDLLESVLAVNRRQNGRLAEKLRRFYGSLAGLKIGVLGLTYKAGTSTLRRSVALEIIDGLIQDGASVAAFDPQADGGEIKPLAGFRRAPSPGEAAAGSDGLLVLTDWPEFRQLDWPAIRDAMRRPVVFDARNMLDVEVMRRCGFAYFGMGRSAP